MNSSKTNCAPILVAGLGNPLMTDEGIGNRIIEELHQLGISHPEIEIIDLGTANWPSVLHAILGRQKVIFVDCARMGEAPATIRRFTPKEAHNQKNAPRLSLHEGDLLTTIEIAQRIGERLPEIVVFGIEPACVAPGLSISPTLESRLRYYVQVIVAELDMATPPFQGPRPDA